MNDPLDRSFFARDAIELAPALIGTVIVRKFRGKIYRARIVETEAYIGEHDLACHAAKGRTKRTEIMFGPAGFAYVYFIYGMHWMLNVVASHEDDAQAVLVRAAEPLDSFDTNLAGPARLCRAMHITGKENGIDLTQPGELFIARSIDSSPPRIKRSKRINVDYARHWKHRLLRFHDTASNSVSRAGS